MEILIKQRCFLSHKLKTEKKTQSKHPVSASVLLSFPGALWILTPTETSFPLLTQEVETDQSRNCEKDKVSTPQTTHVNSK